MKKGMLAGRNCGQMEYYVQRRRKKIVNDGNSRWIYFCALSSLKYISRNRFLAFWLGSSVKYISVSRTAGSKNIYKCGCFSISLPPFIKICIFLCCNNHRFLITSFTCLIDENRLFCLTFEFVVGR